jgi:putative FmdB family regulatory protein
MPTYEYACEACGHKFEEFQSMSAKPIKKCPVCHKNKVQRLISAGAGFIFKGSGFYITDYRSDQYKDAAKKDVAPAAEPAKAEAAKTEVSKDGPPAKADGVKTEAPAPKVEAKAEAKAESKPESKPPASKSAAKKSTVTKGRAS